MRSRSDRQGGACARVLSVCGMRVMSSCPQDSRQALPRDFPPRFSGGIPHLCFLSGCVFYSPDSPQNSCMISELPRLFYSCIYSLGFSVPRQAMRTDPLFSCYSYAPHPRGFLFPEPIPGSYPPPWFFRAGVLSPIKNRTMVVARSAVFITRLFCRPQFALLRIATV